ncbi:hypothetical protein FIBSPDRAFT_565524 [Athelia psychrophila]|uniref:DUF6534 domain-containing protein n=1 Tax=Athelia psychrophila TaxID=1759441 RepID=A0A166HXM7_9AGAM|nr:hypothetical protein FIBSPDRAFT_565524 [Fibularhizoctonia sp. CBS 109695]
MLGSENGATLIAITIAAALLGVNCAQCCFYFSTFPQDRRYLRILVAGVFAFDAIHQILICNWLHTTLIANFGNYAATNDATLSILLSSLFNDLEILMVQCFLLLRVRAMCKHNEVTLWLCGIPLALVVVEFVANLVFFFQARIIQDVSNAATLKNAIIVADVCGAAGDVFIAISLSVLFHRARSGIVKSNTVINTLVLFTLNTGLLTGLCSLLVAPGTFIYTALFFNIGRIHASTMLAVLNARRGLLKALETAEPSLVRLDTYNDHDA